MKSFIVAALVCIFFIANCYARCNCDASDNVCVSKCVVEANSCVTSCKGNIECYENCIDDKWPSADASEQDVADPTPLFKDVLATTTAFITNSASASSSIASSVSASMSAKQADTSNSHVSLGTALRISATAPLLVIASVAYVLL